MTLAELGIMNLFIISILATGFVTLAAGTAIFFGNINRDVPALDSPARHGWALILLSGLITGVGAIADCANYIAGIGRRDPHNGPP